MWFMCERLLVDLLRSDSVFLRSAGIEPCVIDDPCPGPPPLHQRAPSPPHRDGHKVAQGMRRGVGTEASGPATTGFLRPPGGRAGDIDSCGGSHEEGMQQLQRNGKMPAVQGHGPPRLSRLWPGGRIQDALPCVPAVGRVPGVPGHRAEVSCPMPPAKREER